MDAAHADLAIGTELLGADGPLAQRIEGFAPRAAQQRMADAVAAALRDAETLAVEAGTGTGKTYAYLVPVLLSGMRTVISTGTRTLQDQLFHRDLPRVREALAAPVRVALLKGRGNYLCLHRMKRARGLPAMRALFDQLRAVEEWARRTERGELSELGEFREDSPLTRQITSTADNCLGSRCDDFDDCFVAIARRRAQAADVVVVNHHLLLSDFTLKDQGFGQILSGSDAVILDEAHQLPELAAQFFGRRVSTRQIQELARDAHVEAQNCGDLPELAEAAQRLSADVTRLEACFVPGSGRQLLARFRADGVAELPLEQLGQSLDELYALLRPLEERNAEIAGVLERTHGLREHWQHILELPPDEDDAPRAEVRWVEPLMRGGSFHATPIELAEGFRRMRETYPGAWVLTSATLAAGGDFSHFVRTLGIEDARTECLDSPFDYAQQARLYLPRGLPEPNQPGYAEAVAAAALPVIEASGGGAFVLCTSHRALRVIAQQLRARLSLRVLVQGEDTRSALLDDFTADGNAVLVGTSSFWEGVDVRGQALRLVIIDRLPFAAPGDPVLDAKIAAIRSAGGKPFFELQLPEAIVTLRQGVGRLIRDNADHGLLMLCDPRLTQKAYGRQVLAALPRMPVLRELEDATAWMRHLAETVS
ncbi:ATP-dependent DNA helicase [Sinimarinibacterium flocculans]|uniref:ATP-dependent DNA helicase n=1 Tax=Sinimarinibacterium flocculans TaxID=985250 RepID=UPI001FE2E27C|nr:ATP-dependent DNA helicase [Sinimarinibacterium flocculans]